MGSSAANHDRPLWSATMREAAPVTEPFASDGRVDLTVISGGNTATALNAAESGAFVILFEAKTIGWGASGRNGVQVIPGLKCDPSEISATYGVAAGRIGSAG